MTADVRLSLILAKVERAKEHLRDLEVARDRFIESKPYVIEPERDPKTGNYRLHATKLQPPPHAIGLIAGDAIHNLRSALDHLAYHLAFIGTNGHGPFKHIYFPVADNATEYKRTSPRKVKGMAQSAIDAIDAIKPYRGGNNTLWLIHRLDIADKHHSLLVALTHIGEWKVKLFPPFGLFQIPSESSPPLKEGDVFFICEPSVYESAEFTFDVTLAEPEIFAGIPLLRTLQEAANRIDNLIVNFKPLLQ